MSRVIAVMACGLSVAACSASMPSLDFLKSTPQTEALAIESEPPGAEAKAATGESCRTPCQLTVQPGGELSVTLALNGYQPQTVSVREAEGATSKLAPNPVFVQLQPAAAPSARKPAAKKKKPVTAAVRPPPSATASAATPPTPAPAVAPAPAPSAEPAASATNYPWPSR
ncbi:MAG: PEGA domain-containing protein [Xanthobacteraceae bacterium]